MAKIAELPRLDAPAGNVLVVVADPLDANRTKAVPVDVLAGAALEQFDDIREAVTDDVETSMVGVPAPGAIGSLGGNGAAFVLLDPAAADKTFVTEARFGKGPGAGTMTLKSYRIIAGQYVLQRSLTIAVDDPAQAVVTLDRERTRGLYLNAGEYLAFCPAGFDLAFAGKVTGGAGQGLRLDNADSFATFDATVTADNGAAPFQIAADLATRAIAIDKRRIAADRDQVSVLATVLGAISNGPASILGPAALAAGANAGGLGGTFFYVDPVKVDSHVTAFSMWAPGAAGGVVELRSYRRVGANRVLHRTRAYTVANDGSLFSITEAGFDGLFVEAGELLGVTLVGTQVRFGGPKTPQNLAYVASAATTVAEAAIAANAAGAGQTDFQFRIELVERSLGGGGIFAYGTSMVAGDGGTPMPTLLAAAIGRPVINRGVGGQRLPDVLARWGSYPMIVAPPDGVIPADGSFDFFFPYLYARPQPITANNPGYAMTGTLGGVRGTISRLANGAWRFTRASPGAAVRIGAREQFVEEVRDSRYDGIALLEPASNSAGLQDVLGATAAEQLALVIDSTARAVERLGTDRFMIFGPAMRRDEYPGSPATNPGALLNGSQAHDVKLRIEDEMQARWPRQFVNHRAAIFEAFDPSSQPDADAHAAGRMPPSKLADIIHYNTAGNTIWAELIAERGRTLRFW